MSFSKVLLSSLPLLLRTLVAAASQCSYKCGDDAALQYVAIGNNETCHGYTFVCAFGGINVAELLFQTDIDRILGPSANSITEL